MEIANLVLEYLKVLINWPLIVLALAWMFKNPLSEFLKKLRKVGFPGGSLDAEADEASSEVDQVRIASPGPADSTGPEGEIEPSVEEHGEGEVPSPPAPNVPEQPQLPEQPEPAEQGKPVSEPESNMSPLEREMFERRKSVDEGQYYENYRQLALTSPADAVREAYQRVRLSGRRLLQDVVQVGAGSARTLSAIVEQLSDRDFLNPDAIEPAGRLDRIYRLANSDDGDTLSAKGALSFIDAAQKLDSLFTEARRFSIHQRRSRMKAAAQEVDRLLLSHGFYPPMTNVTVMSKALLVRFGHLAPGPGSDLRYEALIDELREFSRHTSVPIRIRHPGDEMSTILVQPS